MVVQPMVSVGVGSAGAGSTGVLRIAMGSAGVRWSLRQQGVVAQMLKVLGILRLQSPLDLPKSSPRPPLDLP